MISSTYGIGSSLAFVAMVGCSGAPDSEVASTESEVRTAACPDEITAQVSALEMRTYFAELPEPAQYAPIKSVAAAFAAKGAFEFKGTLSTQRAGRCTYDAADDAQAVLYTKRGTDVLRIDLRQNNRDVYVFTNPISYSPSLTYAANATARFVTPIAGSPAAPTDEGSPSFVSIGTGKVGAGGHLGLLMASGAEEERDNAPDTLRVTIPAARATTVVGATSHARCVVKRIAKLSNATRTVFDLSLDYDLDDGWNGCEFEFSAPGYSATLRAGFYADD